MPSLYFIERDGKQTGVVIGVVIQSNTKISKHVVTLGLLLTKYGYIFSCRENSSRRDINRYRDNMTFYFFFFFEAVKKNKPPNKSRTVSSVSFRDDH